MGWSDLDGTLHIDKLDLNDPDSIQTTSYVLSPNEDDVVDDTERKPWMGFEFVSRHATKEIVFAENVSLNIFQCPLPSETSSMRISRTYKHEGTPPSLFFS